MKLCWRKLLVALKVVILQILQATGNCRTSVDGIALIEHNFLTIPKKNIYHCHQECKNHTNCQSLNFFKSSHLCQLNNGRIKTKPEKKIMLEDSVYYELPIPIIDACESNPCQHGGTCSNTEMNDFTCACVGEYGGKTCDAISSAECSSHSNISDSTRSINYGVTSKTCDSGLATKWYRFVGPTGVRLPTSAPPKSRCNTDATGWLNGAHPSVHEGIVTRTICFHWSTSTCYFNVAIRVRNCGPYFVYELKPTPNCSLRYCVTI